MSASSSSMPTKYVPREIIRQEFNDGKFWERAQRGELKMDVKDDRHPDIPFEPDCTRSQYVVYYDSDGRFVAGVHQYLRPDGSIGGRGRRPDPKRLVVAGELWAVPTTGKSEEKGECVEASKQCHPKVEDDDGPFPHA